jgi:carbonic anhydrase/acetyltransferase-like protein (isoleucine patch superfamily)
VTVGHQATLHGCTIEHHCLIGMGAIVLDGAILQPYTLLAAGSWVRLLRNWKVGICGAGNRRKKFVR